MNFSPSFVFSARGVSMVYSAGTQVLPLLLALSSGFFAYLLENKNDFTCYCQHIVEGCSI